jgi:regulator of sigma E protease
MTVIGAIIAISLLIVVHEFGHYFVARWCKMRVDRFSLGFGPALWSKEIAGTQFQVAPIPFGGYVQIRGMLVSEEVEGDDPYAYPNRPAWQRFLTIFAGPATNILFAMVLSLGLFTCAGVESGTSYYQVAVVGDDSAARGKLEVGDRVLALDGEPIYVRYDGKRAKESLLDRVQASAGGEVKVTVLRDGEQVTVGVTPTLGEVEDKSAEGGVREVYLLGLELAFWDERVRVNPVTAAGHAVWHPIHMSGAYLHSVYQIITGQVAGELSGPVGIGSYIAKAIEAGWITLLQMLIMLNVIIGLINLFPLPALDGGRLVFLVYEMATRRRANPKMEATVHMVGIMLLLVLLVFVTFGDIRKHLL